MNIITGASGQVGSLILNQLKENNQPVRAIVRNQKSLDKFKGIEVVEADLFNVKSLQEAFKGGTTLFVLTPENIFSDNIIADTRTMLDNYKEAIAQSGIKKIVGLSSMGAQHSAGTGNLVMSYMLEHSFEDLAVEQFFVRPAYYYSNWLGYLETVKEVGILPTFFPVDQKIPMVAPTDVARFIAEVITNSEYHKPITEIMGPLWYSPNDVAHIFGEILNKDVKAEAIPKEQWRDILQQIGFSENSARKLIEMTEAVISGKASPSRKYDEIIKLNSSLQEYLTQVITH